MTRKFTSSLLGSVDDPLADRFRVCPELRDTLARLCDRCNKHGELRGRIKLGDANTPTVVVRALRKLFGSALRTNRRQEHHLDLTRFMETVPDPERWICEHSETGVLFQ